MTTQARLGYGSKLLIGDGGSPETFAEIGEITEGPDDGDSVDNIEVTNHQSPGRRKEYIGALIDGGDLTITVNYIPSDATHNRATGLLGMLGLTKNFRLEEPGNTKGEEWPCIIMNVSRARPVQGAMTMQITLKKAGDVTEYTVTP